MPQRFPAAVTRIIDGDTFVAEIVFNDTLLNVAGTVTRRVRIVGINAPEMHVRPEGPQARTALVALLAAGDVEVEVVKATDDFGRLLANVYAGGVNVATAMIDGGHAVRFRGLAMAGK